MRRSKIRAKFGVSEPRWLTEVFSNNQHLGGVKQ